MADGWDDWKPGAAPGGYERSSGGWSDFGSGSFIPQHKPQHSNSMWFPDFLADNPVSEAVGGAGDTAGRLWGQTRSFATHDVWASLWAAGKVTWHDLSGGKVADPRENSFSYLFHHPVGYFDLYSHDPNVFGGAIGRPLVESYAHKYGPALHGDIGTTLHRMNQDPLGTVLDLTVAGKVLGKAHLAALNRGVEAGKITQDTAPIRYGLSDYGHRVVQLKPYGDAGTGITIDLTHTRGSTTYGRALQDFFDEQRKQVDKISPSIPFSNARRVGKAMRRFREAEFQRYQSEARQAQLAAAELPAEEARAIPLIAELPRWSKDPIGDLHRLYSNELLRNQTERAALKAAGKEIPHRLDAAIDESIKQTIAELESVPKDAVYQPSEKLLRAVALTRKAQETLNRHLTERDILHPERIFNRRFLAHRLLGGTRHVEQQFQKVRVEDLKGKAAVADAKAEMVGGERLRVVRHKVPTDSAMYRRTALYDKETHTLHIADEATHAELATAAGIPHAELGGGRYEQFELSKGSAEHGIPEHWQLGYVSKEEARRLAPQLQRVKNVPVQYGHISSEMLPAAETLDLSPRERLTKANERVRETQRQLKRADKPLAQQYGEYMHRNKSLGRTPKSYREWAADVAPQRTAMSDAIKRHDEAIAEQKAAQAAYTQAREKWHAAKAAKKPAKRVTEPVANTGGYFGGPTIEEMAAAEQDALHSLATGGSLHGPLAQYGESFRRPHITTEDVPSAYTRARLVLARKGLDQSWKKNKGVAWLRGQVVMHPDAFAVDTLRQYRWMATDDAFDQWVVPLSGELDPELSAIGGKTGDEYYVRTKAGTTISGATHRAAAALEDRTANLADDAAYDEAQRNRVFKDLPDDLARKADEDEFTHFKNLEAAGVRRIPADIADLWRRETGGTNAIFRLVVRNGVNQAWRFMLLGIKPAWAVANAMTNEMLLALKYAGVGGGRALLQLVRSSRGERGVAELGRYTMKMPLGPNQMRVVLAEFFPELRSGSFAKQLDRQVQKAGSLRREANRSLPVKTVRTIAKWGSGIGVLGKVRDFNEGFNQWAEDFARDQAALVEIKKFTGSWADTADELRTQLEQLQKDHPEAIDKIVQGVEDILGNYSSLSRAEREWVVTFAPFYPWFKTILGITARYVVHYPERLWALHAMSQAFLATGNSNFELGIPLPDFAHNLIPLFPKHGNDQEVLTLRSSNPFQTPIDIADVVDALASEDITKATPAESGLSLLGPVAQAGFVTLSGKDPYFGGDYQGPGSKQGPLEAGAGSLLNVPQLRLYQQLTHQYKSKVYDSPRSPSVFPGLDQGQWLAVLQYAGIPIRDVNLTNMAARGREEQPQPQHTPGWEDWGSSP